MSQFKKITAIICAVCAVGLSYPLAFFALTWRLADEHAEEIMKYYRDNSK